MSYSGRKLGETTPPPASTPQQSGYAVYQHQPTPPTPAAAPRPSSPPAPAARIPSFAGGSALPPADPSIDTSQRGPIEKRDDEYWRSHELQPGTYNFIAYASKVIEWSTGRLAITLKVSDWDREANRPRPSHDRPIDWDMSRPDLALKMQDGDPVVAEKGRKGYAYWRRDIVEAFTAAGHPEASWPKDQRGNPLIPWWLVLFHQCPDGVFVPVALGIKVVVEPGRQRWPKVAAVAQVQAGGRPVQAPLPYAVVPALAADLRWGVAEVKWWGKPDGAMGQAEVAVLDRNSVPFPHAGLSTYKDL